MRTGGTPPSCPPPPFQTVWLKCNQLSLPRTKPLDETTTNQSNFKPLSLAKLALSHALSLSLEHTHTKNLSSFLSLFPLIHSASLSLSLSPKKIFMAKAYGIFFHLLRKKFSSFFLSKPQLWLITSFFSNFFGETNEYLQVPFVSSQDDIFDTCFHFQPTQY